MKGERTLIDQPFRYGGLLYDYKSDVEDWRGFIEPKCFCCGGDMTNNLRSANGTLLKQNFPYMAVFKITKGRFKGFNRFHILCRACAYDYGRGVIEMDGEAYTDYYAFNERKYKEEQECKS